MKKSEKACSFSRILHIVFFFLVLACAAAPQTVQAASTLKLTAGCTYTLSDDTSITWKSSKPSVAKITGKQKVKAVKTGKAKVVGYVDGQRKYIYTVKVSKFKPVKMTQLKCYSKYCKYMTTSEFTAAYKAACKIVKPYAALSRKEQLYGIASELRYIFEKYGSYSMSTKHYNDPYGYLIKHTASCAGCARTTGLCLNILGIDFEHVNENQYTHQWCRVKVGKSYWICDAFGLYVGKEPGVRKHPYL